MVAFMPFPCRDEADDADIDLLGDDYDRAVGISVIGLTSIGIWP